MVLGMQRREIMRSVDEGGGGAAAAVEEAPEVEETADETADETVETEAEAEPDESRDSAEAEEAEAEADDPEQPTQGGREKTVPLGSLVEIRRENAALKQRLEKMEAQLGDHSAIVDKLKPAEKDALESWHESLPDGNPESDKPEDREAAEFKQDAGLMLRVAKNDGFRKAFLAPILPLIQAMFRSMDLHSFQNEQAVEALAALADVEIGQPEIDADGKVVKPATKLGDKLPAGLKHRERILKHHQEMVGKSGGKWVPVRDAFSAVQAQLKEESGVAGKAASAAAEAATTRTLKEVAQRRAATGGPRSEAAVPRGGPAKPGKRTFAEIENSETDFLIP